MIERRKFLERCLSALTLGGLFVLSGCQKTREPAGFGNQEKLWQLTAGGVKVDEPVEPAYAKDTSAAFRDVSKGKADPSFVPKVVGG
jgi:hypothetical protein